MKVMPTIRWENELTFVFDLGDKETRFEGLSPKHAREMMYELLQKCDYMPQ